MIKQCFYKDLRLGESIIVDLRSPSEFDKGSIPDSINIPLFSDSERHRVGLTYKSLGKGEAVRLGLEFVANKVDVFIRQILSIYDQNKTLVLHCWRGGMRSMATAKLLSSLGLNVSVLIGGYKGYRKHVIETIESFCCKKVLVLMGRTGVGKTEVLRLVKDVPILDFEKYAAHRGSAFGDLNQHSAVPSQQSFENIIAKEIFRYGERDFFVVEIESYFGHLNLPKVIRDKMLSSPVLLLEKKFDQRVSQVLKDYAENWDSKLARNVCNKLESSFSKHFSRQQIDELKNLVLQKNLRAVVGNLFKLRYDPLYDKKLRRSRYRVVSEIDVTYGYEDALQFIRNYETRA